MPPNTPQESEREKFEAEWERWRKSVLLPADEADTERSAARHFWFASCAVQRKRKKEENAG